MIHSSRTPVASEGRSSGGSIARLSRGKCSGSGLVGSGGRPSWGWMRGLESVEAECCRLYSWLADVPLCCRESPVLLPVSMIELDSAPVLADLAAMPPFAATGCQNRRFQAASCLLEG